jgi:hypothetical protein
VVKADQFLTAMQKNMDNASFLGLLGGLAKATFSESIDEIAKKLIRLHRPFWATAGPCGGCPCGGCPSAVSRYRRRYGGKIGQLGIVDADCCACRAAANNRTSVSLPQVSGHRHLSPVWQFRLLL